MKGEFDVIFCRNVVIYFDQPTKESLFQRYAEKLCTEGHLFLGHSESMNKSQTQFVALGKTMYRKAFWIQNLNGAYMALSTLNDIGIEGATVLLRKFYPVKFMWLSKMN